MRLNAIQWDLIRRHVGPFVFCLTTILFLLVMQFLILYLDKIVGKGLETGVILELILTQVPAMLVLAVPMSVLVATLIAYGRFAEQNELTAVKAAGVSPWKLIQPVFAIAVGLSVIMAWFGNWVLPEANFRSKSLFIDIRMAKPGFDLKANTFYDGMSGYTFLVRRLSAESDTLHDVTLFQDPTENREEAVISADWGLLTTIAGSSLLQLSLYEGSVLRYLGHRTETEPRVEETQFREYRIRFDLRDLSFSRTNPDLRQRDDRTMSAQAMAAVRDSLQRIISEDRDYQFSLQPMLVLQKPFPTLPDTVSPTYTLERRVYGTDPPRQTAFVALNRLQNVQEQRYAIQQGSFMIHDAEANLESIRSSTQWRIERMAQFMVEIHKKLALPVACAVFVILGAPLGMLIRKGNLGFHTVLSAILFTFYWISIIQGEKLGDRLIVPPMIGMWFGNTVMFVLGMVLLYRLSTERRAKDLIRP
jgi:lipopolysaccharide export system permease protein